MENLINNVLNALIGVERAEVWCRLTACIDQLYDVDRIWNKGFGEWLHEYKYRRGGKTLCTFYAKKDAAVILIIFGKNEREKFELQRDFFRLISSRCTMKRSPIMMESGCGYRLKTGFPLTISVTCLG